MSGVLTAPFRLFDFFGGLKLDYRKDLSTRAPIERAPIPPQLILPLSQHAGAPAKPCVRPGDYVYRGQTIARAEGYVSLPVHATTSGTIAAIESRPIPHPSGLSAPCIVLDSDGRDAALPEPEWPAAGDDWRALSPETIRERVRAAGIAGLGGAAFPSFIKLNPGKPVDLLVLNGAECEPYITCDDLLMQERALDIVHGAQLILHALNAQRCMIGIEDNKPDAITALQQAARAEARVEIVPVPTRYPQGGSKQLIQTLTGQEIPSEGLSLDLGMVPYNVATAAAVWDAIVHGRPLISRVVTVTGYGVAQPRNYEARLGTPFGFLIEQAGGYVDGTHQLIMGGPMMGHTVRGDEVPVTKATNCILVATDRDIAPPQDAMPCIRCGECAEVCPARLLPQQLYWHARGREYAQAEAYHLFDCIECGCCAQVCPSHIPLVQYYRHAKTEIWTQQREKRKADAARERHEARIARLEREERAKEEARARRKAQLAAARKATAGEAEPAETTDPVARAIAAAKARKAAPTVPPATQTAGDDPVARAIAAAKARKATARTADTAPAPTDTAAPPQAGANEDPVARAVAAAKARKAARATAPASDDAPAQNDSGNAAGNDPVARAIAAAKARKAASAATTAGDASATGPSAASAADSPDDPVARAIAAAKAKKAARTAAAAAGTPSDTRSAQDSASSDDGDPVARAVAAAKASKAARSAAGEAPPPQTEPQAASVSDAEDPVARAIAAAKARKAAREAGGTGTDGDAGQ